MHRDDDTTTTPQMWTLDYHHPSDAHEEEAITNTAQSTTTSLLNRIRGALQQQQQSTTRLNEPSTTTTHFVESNEDSLSPREDDKSQGLLAHEAAADSETRTGRDCHDATTTHNQPLSFFFRNQDESNTNTTNTRKKRRLLAIPTNTNSLDNHHHPYYSNSSTTPILHPYVDAREIMMGPSVWQHYLHKYQQLNCEMDHNSNNNNNNTEHNDLLLTEHPTPETNNTLEILQRMPTWQQSSLMFLQDGRKLMLLPQDSVRLLMDPDLEPGVLAVEQTRLPSASDHPPLLVDLRYVLTVPSDLYRRLVTEMSNAMTTGCYCSDEGRKTDIRIAILILSCTMLVLFFLTMFWVTE